MKSLLWSLVVCATVTASFALVCPDGSTCTDDSTCCEIADNRYGCCPLVDAVCCDDKEHCCPSGYTCSEGLCFKSEHATRLNSTTVCPGGQYTCPDDFTCCPFGNVFTCCPLPSATCCADGQHCCPSGTTCDVAHQTCNVPIVKIANAASSFSKANVVVCPGGAFECPDGSTCCLLTSGDYGCCPLPDAVCCEDKVHCCPSGYTCDTGRCTQLASPTPAPSPLSIIQPVAHHPSENYVQCPDGSSQCPNDNTCCILSTGKYGCCPLPRATCCSDHIHCCPNGSTCDVTKGRCNSDGADGNTPMVVPWVTKTPAIPREPENSHNKV